MRHYNHQHRSSHQSSFEIPIDVKNIQYKIFLKSTLKPNNLKYEILDSSSGILVGNYGY